MKSLFMAVAFLAFITACSGNPAFSSGISSAQQNSTGTPYTQIEFSSGSYNGDSCIVDLATGSGTCTKTVNGVTLVPAFSCNASQSLLASLNQNLTTIQPVPNAGVLLTGACMVQAPFNLYEGNKVLSINCNYNLSFSDQNKIDDWIGSYFHSCGISI